MMESTFTTVTSKKSDLQNDFENDPTPISVHVGGRIRMRRKLMGMSQERLGELLGLAFQQVQSYERGANRLGAARLFDLSCVLDVPISFFYSDDSGPTASQLTHETKHSSEAQHGPETAGNSREELLNRSEILELANAYYSIYEPSVRERVFELIKSMGPLAA